VVAGVLVAVMVVAAFSLWTVIPFGWIWVGSMISSSQAPSMGPYAVVFFGIVISIIAVVLLLAWLNRIYADLVGTTELDPQRIRLVRSLSDERRPMRNWSVMEAVILASVLAAGFAMLVWFFVSAGSPLPNQ
jgi:hypothetical protein